MNQVFLFSLIHYFDALFFSFTQLYGLINLYHVLSHGEPFCSEAKFSDKKVLALQSRLHGKFFHVIAKIIFTVFTDVPRSRQTEPACVI